MRTVIEALEKAAAQFRFYEGEHRKKAEWLEKEPRADEPVIDGTMRKAEVNREMAEMCEAAIEEAGRVADTVALNPAADRLAALQPQSPSLMGSVEGVRDQALEEAATVADERATFFRGREQELIGTGNDLAEKYYDDARVAEFIADKIRALRSSPSSPTIAPPDPVVRQMAEALREAKDWISPDFPVYDRITAALNLFDGRK